MSGIPQNAARKSHKDIDLDELVSPRDDLPTSPQIPFGAEVEHRVPHVNCDNDEEILPGSPTDVPTSTKAHSRLDPMRASTGGSKFDRFLHSNMLFDTSGSPRNNNNNNNNPITVKRNNFFESAGGAEQEEAESSVRRNREFQSEGGAPRILSVATPRASQNEDDTSSPFPRNRKASMAGWEEESVSRAPAPVEEGSEEEEDQDPGSSEQDSLRPSARRISSSSTQEWVASLRERISAGLTPEVFLRDGPKGGLVRCYVIRKKNAFGGSSSYQLYLSESDSFLLAARKRKKTKSSVFIISQSVEDLHRDSVNCLAKLKANFVGTEYELWGKWDDKSAKKGYGHELMAICFRQSLLQSKGGPRIMHVARPVGSSRRGDKDEPESLVGCLDLADRRELAPSMEKQLVLMATKTPHFDQESKVYSLDFGGRVKEASVKNFQLVTWDHNANKFGEAVLLQFGKVTSDSFILDFGHPFCLHSAFAIALASIDSKLCYSF